MSDNEQIKQKLWCDVYLAHTETAIDSGLAMTRASNAVTDFEKAWEGLGMPEGREPDGGMEVSDGAEQMHGMRL